jgi:predicted Abi (CAAX) family protease
MTVTADLGSTLHGVLALQPGAFVRQLSARSSVLVAVAIVLLAGFSEAVGQSVVLFANRVKPTRFVFSLAIQALLFAFGYAFMVVSTWAIGLLPLATHVSVTAIALAFALSYAPLLFAFFGALPYLGVPIAWVLRIWHLLAMLVGFTAVSGVSIGWAALYVGLGWLVLVTAAHSFGKPIATLGARLVRAVAGVELGKYDIPVDTAHFGTAIGSPMKEAAQSDGAAVALGAQPTRRGPWKAILGVIIAIGLGIIVAFALTPLRQSAFGWQQYLPGLAQIPLSLLWVGVIAVVVAGLLAPLETLGWWAGWYGGDVNTGLVQVPTEGGDAGAEISRFVVYLDGVAQSSARYTPDIERFLDALALDLPENVRLIRGLMAYSVINRPLEADPFFSTLWRIVEKARLRNINSILGMVINLRNCLIVAVSADRRYGPIYNLGIAQLVYNSLIANGYRPGCGVPVTLIGYSGGGQMSAASSALLKRAIGSPLDVISLGGVMSGASKIVELEQLYHLAGKKDGVQRIGGIVFPTRWKIAVLSNWNQALRLGRISFVPLGPVGHQVPGGMFDPNARLPDGRTFLRQTIDVVTNILSGNFARGMTERIAKPSNYERYIQMPWNQPGYYPFSARVDPDRYLPIGEWMGRLILPKPVERAAVRGAWFEVYHADDQHGDLVGRTVKLRWSDDPETQRMVRGITRDVHFSPKAEYTSRFGGLVHPVRLNHWQLVDPLESLAGSHPVDDVTVKLVPPVGVEAGTNGIVLRISIEPVQITGRYYGLVHFDAPVAGDDRFSVTHFNRATRDFDGPSEVVRLPQLVLDGDGRMPSSTHDIEYSPLNADGWYVYGAPDTSGAFVVQALAPRALLRSSPDRTIDGKRGARRYARRGAWADVLARKGTTTSTFLRNDDGPSENVLRAWKEGDAALLVHVFGGIGGRKREETTRTPIYFGHFSYGIAEVVREPLANELSFDIVYHQVYTHNTDGLIAGAMHWSRYMGDRQFGWAGLRPVCDTLIASSAFTADFSLDGRLPKSVLSALRVQLDAMTARYRIGDGSGGVYVGLANNCALDSNRALLATLRALQEFVTSNPAFETWAAAHPEERLRYESLVRLAADLRSKLRPLASSQRDSSDNEFNFVTTMEDDPIGLVRSALRSWRVILPRLASDTIVGSFLRHESSAWALFADQIGGRDDAIRPVAPTTL